MKKLLGIMLGFGLTLGIAGVSLAADFSTSTYVGGWIEAGYLNLPGYKPNRLGDITNHNQAYDEGAFYSDFNIKLGLRNNLKICDGFTAQLVSQMQVFKDDTSRPLDTVADPISNFNLTYNPGLVKLMFDAKGQEVAMGSVPNEEILVLNVARLYAKDGNQYLYLDPKDWAKQLTVEVPFQTGGRAVAVFSLEPTSDGKPGDFIGAFGEMNIGNGKVGLGYRAKCEDYPHPLTSETYFLAFDYKFISGVRLQLDYITRDDKKSGGKDYWQPIDIIDIYPETPFKIRQRLKARLTINNFVINAHLIDTNANLSDNESHDPVLYDDSGKAMWPDNDLAYQVGASYAFKPYNVGFNYRNWAFDEENLKAEEAGYVAEFYVKHDLSFSTRDYLKVFYRTDDSYGAVIMVNFY